MFCRRFIYLSLLLVVFFSIQESLAIDDVSTSLGSNMSSDTTSDSVTNSQDSNDLNSELNRETITTKIYRSTDNNEELLEGESGFNQVFENEIVAKEDLISMTKIIHKKINTSFLNSSDLLDPKNNPVLPWMLFVFGFLFLAGLICLIKKLKL